MSDGRNDARATTSAKRTAIADYDAWVEADLGSRRGGKLTLLIIGGAIAATVIIGAMRLWDGARRDDVDIGDRPNAATLAPNADDLDKQLEAMPIRDHVRVFRIAQRTLEDRLLTGPAKWSMRFFDEAPGRDGGVARILDRGERGLVSMPGGGAYFSFTKRSNSQRDDPDLAMVDWAFTSAAKDAASAVVRLPAMNGLVEASGHIPAWLRAPSKAFADAVRRRRPAPPKAEVDGFYAVRSIHWNRADVLVAFRVYDKGPYGVSFGWTMLERREAPRK